MDEIINDYKEVLFSCFIFNGRLNRRKFWIFFGLTILIQFLLFVLGIVFIIIFEFICAKIDQPILGSIGFFILVGLIVFCDFILGICTFGPQACRLNDGGFSPLLLLLYFTQIGAIVPLILCCMESKD